MSNPYLSHPDTNAKLNISKFSASNGGAIHVYNSTIHVNTGNIHFGNNRASLGGAMFFEYGTMNINSNKSVEFVTNIAQIQGGAICIKAGIHSSVIVGDYGNLLVNNSAFQGGTLYVVPSSFAIEVGYQSSINFVNNTAVNVGGAVYAELQAAAPCLFMITDYSAKISFIGNYAQLGIGNHMYGTSMRADECDAEHTEWGKKQGKGYCLHQDDAFDEHINISFDPKTLSLVSYMLLCMCVSVTLMANHSVPMSRTFSPISACIVVKPLHYLPV